MARSSVDSYYHATMKKTENQIEFRKKQIKKYAPISHKYKKMALSKDIERLKAVFSIRAIQEMKHPRSFSSDSAFHDYIKQFPLHKCFEGNIQLKQYFPCVLFENQLAWFYRDEFKAIRYYTKIKNGVPIALDIIDLLEILYDVNSFEAKSLFLQWTKAVIVDTFYENALRTRYEENHHGFTQLLTKSKAVRDLLSPLKIVYEEMLKIGASPNYLTTTAYEFEMFFVSTRYLEARLETIHYSNISRILNTLNGLGFIQKMELEELSASTKKKILAWTKAMGYERPVSFFKIPSIKDISNEITARINILLEEGISYRDAYTLLRHDVDSHLAGLKPTSVSESIEIYFKNCLESHGYVSKTLLTIETEGIFTKKEIESSWQNLLKDNQCVFIKPNRAMKNHYQLASLEYIAIKK